VEDVHDQLQRDFLVAPSLLERGECRTLHQSHAVPLQLVAGLGEAEVENFGKPRIERLGAAGGLLRVAEDVECGWEGLRMVENFDGEEIGGA
jgi:hypothetical protein